MSVRFFLPFFFWGSHVPAFYLFIFFHFFPKVVDGVLYFLLLLGDFFFFLSLLSVFLNT